MLAYEHELQSSRYYNYDRWPCVKRSQRFFICFSYAYARPTRPPDF